MDQFPAVASGAIGLIAFDLDDTLAASKQPLAADMADHLLRLLGRVKVAVVSGASFGQLTEQFLGHLHGSEADLTNLYLIPTNGARLYEHKDKEWVLIYELSLSEEERGRIKQAFDRVLRETGFADDGPIYGTRVEDRGTQVTFSGLGSEAPLDLRQKWDPDHVKRNKIAAGLREMLPEFSISLGGMTSIDVTKKGIDKAYGMEQLAKHLGLPLEKCAYVGDALYPGGNDAVVNRLGIATVPVSGVEDTKKFIEEVLGGK